MNLYSDKCVPITKTVLLSLCKLIEVLKCIYLSFKKNSFVFIYSILLIIQQLSYKASSLLHNLKVSSSFLLFSVISLIFQFETIFRRVIYGKKPTNKIKMLYLL